MKQTPRRTWKAGTPAPEPKSPLGHLVVRRMTELGERQQGYPLSYRQVAVSSGGLVSAPTVGNVIRDEGRNPSDNTLAGLALALDVDENLLRKAWEAGQQQQWKLPAKFQGLDVEGWERLLEYGDFLLGKHRLPDG